MRISDWSSDVCSSDLKCNFGILASGAYSKANLGNNYAGISGGPFGNNDWGGGGDNWISPHGYDTFHREVERDRLGLSGAVQWEIDPGITLTGEVFYTKLKEHNRAAGLNIRSEEHTYELQSLMSNS